MQNNSQLIRTEKVSYVIQNIEYTVVKGIIITVYPLAVVHAWNDVVPDIQNGRASKQLIISVSNFE